MKIGISPGSPAGLYKAVGSRPMHEGIFDGNGALIGLRYLSVPQLRATTEKALKHAESLGVECLEIYNTVDRIEALIPVLKNREDMELTIHECNTERIYPGSRRISSVNPQVRKVVTEHLNWLIDIAAEVNARAIVLHPAFVGNAARNTVDGGFGADNILPFEAARRCQVELLKTCAERACKQGVILALENMHVNLELPRSYVIRTAEEQVELIDEVNSSGLQCTFDVGHVRTKGTSPTEYASILGQRIAHVHLKDSDENGGYLRLGAGDIDLVGVMKLLAKIEAQRCDEISIVLENENDAGAGYKEEWEKLKKLKTVCIL